MSYTGSVVGILGPHVALRRPPALSQVYFGYLSQNNAKFAVSCRTRLHIANAVVCHITVMEITR